MNKTLTQVYYNPANPSSFGGKEAVYIAAKTINPEITREKVHIFFSFNKTVKTVHKSCAGWTILQRWTRFYNTGLRFDRIEQERIGQDKLGHAGLD